MTHLTVIDSERTSAPAVLDLLAEAEIPSGAFCALAKPAPSDLDPRLETQHREVRVLGETSVAGEAWDERVRPGESLSDFLFRNGIDAGDAHRVERGVSEGRVAFLVWDDRVDTRGLKIRLEREPTTDIVLPGRVHGPGEDRTPEGTRAEVRQGDVRGFARGGQR